MSAPPSSPLEHAVHAGVSRGEAAALRAKDHMRLLSGSDHITLDDLVEKRARLALLPASALP